MFLWDASGSLTILMDLLEDSKSGMKDPAGRGRGRWVGGGREGRGGKVQENEQRKQKNDELHMSRCRRGRRGGETRWKKKITPRRINIILRCHSLK